MQYVGWVGDYSSAKGDSCTLSACSHRPGKLSSVQLRHCLGLGPCLAPRASSLPQLAGQAARTASALHHAPHAAPPLTAARGAAGTKLESGVGSHSYKARREKRSIAWVLTSLTWSLGRTANPLHVLLFMRDRRRQQGKRRIVHEC